MAAEATLGMLKALADKDRLKMFERLAEGERSEGTLSKELSMDRALVKEKMTELVDSGLAISADDDDTVYSLDAQQVAVLTGFFELMYDKCKPMRCC
jgi:DNA-binding transcriptional ArsR family regulator